MRKHIAFGVIAFLLFVSLTGCKSKNDEESAVSDSETSMETVVAPSTDWEAQVRENVENNPPQGDENAILYDGGATDIYTPIHIEKGQTVTIPQKTGYKFDGYKTIDGVTYIDDSGLVVMQCAGKNLQYLKAEFLPEFYEVSFYLENGDLDKSKASIDCEYTYNLLRDLGIGRTITNSKGAELCVIGYADSNGNEIITVDTLQDTSEIKVKDFGDCVNYGDKTVSLYAITTPTSYMNQRLDSYDITDNGLLNQSLNSHGIAKDEFPIGETIDINALKLVGYTSAKIKITCNIEAVSGTQRIQILNKWVEKESQIKDALLLDSGKIEVSKDSHERYTQEVTVPIEKIGDTLYVGYNAEGLPIAKDSWLSSGMDIDVEFLM